MSPKLTQLMNRLEVLSSRERVMALVGVPLLLVLLGEAAVFDPARRQTVEHAKAVVAQAKEMEALQGVLQGLQRAQAEDASVPAADQLLRQRDGLLAEVNAARALLDRLDRHVDWTSVLRGAGVGKVSLIHMKTLPREVVFTPAAAVAAAAAKIGRAHV